jgi:hypothetical protein
MKAVLVKFRDGKYGVRREVLIRGVHFKRCYEFQDLVDSSRFWEMGSSYFLTNCRGTRERAEYVLQILQTQCDFGEEVTK